MLTSPLSKDKVCLFVLCCCDKTLTKTRLWREELVSSSSPNNCMPPWDARKDLKAGAKQEEDLCVDAFSWLDSQALLSYYPSYTARAHLSRDPRAHMELGPPMPVRRQTHKYGGISLMVSPFFKADNTN